MDDIIKTVIAVDTSLHMRAGKTLAQVGHAAQASILNRAQLAEDVLIINLKDNPILKDWWIQKGYTKIVIGVPNVDELMKLYNTAKEAGIHGVIIEDDGIQPNPSVTYTTCIGLGPDYASKLDPLTGGYKLLDL